MNSKIQESVFAIVLLSLSACVSSGKADYKASEVIERIGGKNETPDWATGEITMTEEKGNVIFINTTSLSGDSRSDACVKIASDSARTEILRHIKDNITASGQINEISATSDPGMESLTAFLSQGKLSGVSVQQKYWEKRVESNGSGERVLRLHCAAKVAISKSELNRQLREAVGQGGNPEIRQKLLDAQKTFIDGLSGEAQPK